MSMPKKSIIRKNISYQNQVNNHYSILRCPRKFQFILRNLCERNNSLILKQRDRSRQPSLVFPSLLVIINRYTLLRRGVGNWLLKFYRPNITSLKKDDLGNLAFCFFPWLFMPLQFSCSSQGASLGIQNYHINWLVWSRFGLLNFFCKIGSSRDLISVWQGYYLRSVFLAFL